MRRRAFVAAVGGALAWSFSAPAQQPGRATIGYLNGVSSDRRLVGFRKGLNESGFVEGRNVAIEYRLAHGDFSLLPAMAADLVEQRVSVIFATGGDAAALAAKAATSTIPIVFVLGGDPVQYGLVASLARPGGNATGVVNFNAELIGKRLELTREILPNAKSISLLVNSASPIAEFIVADAEAAARQYGWRLHVLRVNRGTGLDSVFAEHVRGGADALVVSSGSYFVPSRERFASVASRLATPVIYDRREFVTDGGLVSYGAETQATSHQAGIYVGRILGGASPSDLPVVQTSKLELVVNLKAARDIGLTLPDSLVARADEVIE